MKLAANVSLLYTELPFLERFKAAAADGFRAIEIQFPYDTSAADIQHELAAYDLECVLINVPAGDLMTGGRGLACVPEKRAEFLQALELCAEYVKVLSPSRVNILAGRSSQPGRANDLSTLHKNLLAAADVLSPLGVIVTFEAINIIDMPGFLISTFDDMTQVMDTLRDDRIRMQFDIYHMVMMEEPVLELLAKHGNQIGHIQFADVPGRHEPGTGTLDFTELFAVIEASNYQGWVAAEYRPQGESTSVGLGWLNNVSPKVIGVRGRLKTQA